MTVASSDKPPVIPTKHLTLENMQAAGLVRFLPAMLFAKVGSKHLSPGLAFKSPSHLSYLSKKPTPNQPLIVAYSAGVYGMAKGLGVDLKPIRDNVVVAVAVRTPTLAELRDAHWSSWMPW